MKGREFIEALQKELGLERQSELAVILGKLPSNIAGLKNKVVSPLMVARIISRLNGQIVRGAELVPDIKAKLKSRTDRETARLLGMTQTALIGWKNRRTGITAAQICNAFASTRAQARKAAHESAFRPVVEFFPIAPAQKEKSYDVFDDSSGRNRQRSGLKGDLSKTHGLYIFYDTRGRALYVGKAVKASIWKEMNLAFNRTRSAQVVSLVKHPVSNVQYVAAHRKLRQPTDTNRKLVDLAAYFSAYEVDESLVDNFEALFIRAFPNDLLNYRMEKLGSPKAKTVKGSKDIKTNGAKRKVSPAAD